MNVTHHTIQRLFKIKSELHEVYWNLIIQTFAKSMIGIFVPIYLLILGVSLQSVLIFVLIFYGTLGVSSLFIAKITAKTGFKHLILYRISILIIFYLILIWFQFIDAIGIYHVLLVGIVGGFSSVMYWIPLNTELVKNTKKIHEGQEIAFALALPRLAAIVAPTFSALLLIYFGFTPMFAFIVFLLMLSVIPLFATSDYKPKFKLSQEFRLIKMNKMLSPHLLIRGILVLSEGILWPIFIFLTLADILDVGIAASVTAVGIAFFTILTGRLTDKGYRNKLRKFGGLSYGILWFYRIFAHTQMEIFLLSFLGGMIASTIEVSVFSSFCDQARGKNVLNWVVSREVFLAFGRILMVILLLLAFGLDIKVGFGVAGLASMLFIFI